MSFLHVIDSLNSTTCRNPMVYPKTHITGPISFDEIDQREKSIEQAVLESRSIERDVIVYDIRNQHMMIDGKLYDTETQKPQPLGSWSTVFFMRSQSDNTRHVLKLMRSKYTDTIAGHHRFCKEILFQTLADDVGVAPVVHKYGWCCIQSLSQDPTYFILMEYIGRPISMPISKSTLDKVYVLYKTLLTVLNMSVLDINVSNILYHRSTNTYRLIDFDPGCSFETVSFISASHIQTQLNQTREAVNQLVYETII